MRLHLSTQLFQSFLCFGKIWFLSWQVNYHLKNRNDRFGLLNFALMAQPIFGSPSSPSLEQVKVTAYNLRTVKNFFDGIDEPLLKVTANHGWCPENILTSSFLINAVLTCPFQNSQKLCIQLFCLTIGTTSGCYNWYPGLFIIDHDVYLLIKTTGSCFESPVNKSPVRIRQVS